MAEEAPRLYVRTNDEAVSAKIAVSLFQQMALNGRGVVDPESYGKIEWAGTWGELHYMLANALEEAKAQVAPLPPLPATGDGS